MMLPDARNKKAVLQQLALNVRTFRQRKNMSLSELGRIAGVGKATLSLLESTKANPSIETLSAIATALGVPFAQLAQPIAADVRLLKRSQAIKLESKVAFESFLLNSSGRRGTCELYLIRAAAGKVYEGSAHTMGTEECVFVLRGKLRVGPKDGAVIASEGDVVSFAADRLHVYEAVSKKAEAVVVMNYA